MKLILLFFMFNCFVYGSTETAVSRFNVELAMDSFTKKKIVIFGAGYIGCVTGACLSKIGHEITFVDPDSARILMIKEGKSPFVEENLGALINEGVLKKLICSTEKIEGELGDADIVIVAVQTPSDVNGNSQTIYLENVFNTLKEVTVNRTKPLIISIRSTILPTLARKIHQHYFEDSRFDVDLVINPEFLRESTAVHDFFFPPLCVAGGDNGQAVEAILSLYAPITEKRIATSLEAACILKYACNTFHAIKAAFANEMGSLCESLNINPHEVMSVFRQDSTLNCSAAYLKPGFSFGGPCLLKDVQALNLFGGGAFPLLGSIIESNQAHFDRKVGQIVKGNHQKIVMLGITFKKNSDDLRDSPFLQLAHVLYNQGVTLTIYDNDLTEYSKTVLGDLSSFVSDDLDSVLESSEAVVLCKELLNEKTLQELRSRGVMIYNLTNRP